VCYVCLCVRGVDYNVNGGMRVQMSAHDIHLSNKHTHYVLLRFYIYVQQATLLSLSYGFKDAPKWDKEKIHKFMHPKKRGFEKIRLSYIPCLVNIENLFNIISYFLFLT